MAKQIVQDTSAQATAQLGLSLAVPALKGAVLGKTDRDVEALEADTAALFEETQAGIQSKVDELGAPGTPLQPDVIEANKNAIQGEISQLRIAQSQDRRFNFKANLNKLLRQRGNEFSFMRSEIMQLGAAATGRGTGTGSGTQQADPAAKAAFESEVAIRKGMVNAGLRPDDPQHRGMYNIRLEEAAVNEAEKERFERAGRTRDLVEREVTKKVHITAVQDTINTIDTALMQIVGSNNALTPGALENANNIVNDAMLHAFKVIELNRPTMGNTAANNMSTGLRQLQVSYLADIKEQGLEKMMAEQNKAFITQLDSAVMSTTMWASSYVLSKTLGRDPMSTMLALQQIQRTPSGAAFKKKHGYDVIDIPAGIMDATVMPTHPGSTGLFRSLRDVLDGTNLSGSSVALKLDAARLVALAQEQTAPLPGPEGATGTEATTTLWGYVFGNTDDPRDLKYIGQSPTARKAALAEKEGITRTVRNVTHDTLQAIKATNVEDPKIFYNHNAKTLVITNGNSEVLGTFTPPTPLGANGLPLGGTDFGDIERHADYMEVFSDIPRSDKISEKSMRTTFYALQAVELVPGATGFASTQAWIDDLLTTVTADTPRKPGEDSETVSGDNEEKGDK